MLPLFIREEPDAPGLMRQPSVAYRASMLPIGNYDDGSIAFPVWPQAAVDAYNAYARGLHDVLNPESNWFTGEPTLHSRGSPAGLLSVGGPAPGLMQQPESEPAPGLMGPPKPTPKTPGFFDLLKLGVQTDMERLGNAASAVYDPLRRLFVEGGWQKGPDDPQAASDMRDLLMTTGLGTTALSTAPANSLGTFVGHRAAENLAERGFRKPNDWGGSHRLNWARAAEKRGDAAADIWQEHGWMRGADGVWRTEIDDTPLQVNATNPKYNVGLGRKAGEIYHPELQKAYPEFRDMTTWVEQSPGTSVARSSSGSPWRGSVEVYGEDANAMRSNAAHELQHHASNMEGFDVGAPSSSPAYWRSTGEVEARATQKRLPLTMRERRDRFPGLDYDTPMDMQMRSPRSGSGDVLGEAGKRVDKTTTEVAAARLTRDVRAAEDKLRAAGASSEEIAQELGRRFGVKQSAADIERGHVWWRIDEMPGAGSASSRVAKGRYASTEQMNPELKGFLESEAIRDLTNKEVSRLIEEKFGIQKTPNAVRLMRERRALPTGDHGKWSRYTPEQELIIERALGSELYDGAVSKKLFEDHGIKISKEGVRLRRKRMDEQE